MAKEKSPAFQFYPKDFLSDEKQAAMSAQECGVYIRLMCRCWLEGSIPDDLPQVARLGGVTTAQLRKFWPAIRRCFSAHETDPGRLVHGRLERERAKQRMFSRRQSDKGKASAALRSTAVEVRLPPGCRPVGDSVQPEVNSSISSLQSSTSVSVQTAIVEEGIPERASAFLDTYAALYAKHRHGARLHRRPSLDFDRALGLCRTWADDGRLGKMAEILLTTDDEWISRTDRGFGVFVSRASWCDDRLSEWEAKQRPA